MTDAKNTADDTAINTADTSRAAAGDDPTEKFVTPTEESPEPKAPQTEPAAYAAAPTNQSTGKGSENARIAHKRRPLFATMIWGAMMLALAAFFAGRELVPGGLDLVTWLLTAVVGIGLLLVVAGIAAASRRAE
jgi:hypothetical protein